VERRLQVQIWKTGDSRSGYTIIKQVKVKELTGCLCINFLSCWMDMSPINPIFSDPTDFCWATGIEDTFIPHARPGFRSLEEYELTQHYDLWEQDIERAASLGVRAIRWGIPWYRVQPSPGRYDWSWTDRVLDAIVNRHGLLPILDLVHYGTPDWLDNSFINCEYPNRVSEYAAAVARRYRGLVQVYTPLNEPLVNADFCGRKGEWPPYLVGDDGFVKVLAAIAKGIVLSVQAIREEDPDATILQVEAAWHYWTLDPRSQNRVSRDNQRQYLSADLCTGRVNESHPFLPYLIGNGVPLQQLDWFQQNAVTFDILGANFYPWSYGELISRENGELRRRKTPVGASAVAKVLMDVYEHYDLPVMLTETSANASIDGRKEWMDATIQAVFELRVRGIPIVGYTWFPMMSMIDWAYRVGRRPLKDYLLHLGLYDSTFDGGGILQRQETPLVDHYRRYIHQSAPGQTAEPLQFDHVPGW
jgi:beta-glucosidase/6-phospho-beta-glucosidase/beta-galactosidase